MAPLRVGADHDQRPLGAARVVGSPATCTRRSTWPVRVETPARRARFCRHHRTSRRGDPVRRRRLGTPVAADGVAVFDGRRPGRFLASPRSSRRPQRRRQGPTGECSSMEASAHCGRGEAEAVSHSDQLRTAAGSMLELVHARRHAGGRRGSGAHATRAGRGVTARPSRAHAAPLDTSRKREANDVPAIIGRPRTGLGRRDLGRLRRIGSRRLPPHRVARRLTSTSGEQERRRLAGSLAPLRSGASGTGGRILEWPPRRAARRAARPAGARAGFPASRWRPTRSPPDWDAELPVLHDPGRRTALMERYRAPGGTSTWPPPTGGGRHRLLRAGGAAAVRAHARQRSAGARERRAGAPARRRVRRLAALGDHVLGAATVGVPRRLLGDL
jgi:hypothetical protein